MNEQRCGNCRFFKDAYETGEMNIDDDNLEVRGYCHRFPPQVILNHDGDMESRFLETNFPEIHIDEWCGEWKALGL